jgi:hypothetical protein
MPNAIACARKVTNTAGVSQRLYYDGERGDSTHLLEVISSTLPRRCRRLRAQTGLIPKPPLIAALLLASPRHPSDGNLARVWPSQGSVTDSSPGKGVRRQPLLEERFPQIHACRPTLVDGGGST